MTPWDTPLYHGTSLTRLLEIVRGDELVGSGHGVSLSRSPRVALRFAANAVRRSSTMTISPVCDALADLEWEIGGSNPAGAVLVFSKTRLSRRYRIVPLDWMNKWTGDGRFRGRPNDEAEERIETDIRGVLRFVDAIWLVNPDQFAAFETGVRTGHRVLGKQVATGYLGVFEAVRSRATNARFCSFVSLQTQS